MKDKISVKKLNGLPGTLLYTLRARYLETKRDDGIINDPKSVEIMESIDHDFSKFDFIAKSKILIAECTFVVDEHIERALAGAHMHVDEFVKMIKCLDNERIIITHLSQRTHIGQAKKILKEKLGDELYPKVLMLMDRKHRQF